MTNVKISRATQSNVDNIEYNDGQIILTNEGRAYADFPNEQRLMLTNTLIVTNIDGVTKSSHTSEEIMQHINSGGTAILFYNSIYYAMLYSCNSSKAIFQNIDIPSENLITFFSIDDKGHISRFQKTYYTSNNLSTTISATSTTPVAGSIIYNAMSDLQKQIDTLKADMEYVPIEITNFSVTPAYAKYGQSPLNGFTFNWTLNSAIVKSQQWNDIPITNTTIRTYTPVSALTKYTHTLSVTDNRDLTVTKDLTIPIYDAIFYGVNANSTITNLENISPPKWQETHTKTFTVEAGANQYIYYACIDSKNPTFKVGGFDGGFSQVGIIAYTNGRTYKVFRSDNKGLGSTTVEVK